MLWVSLFARTAMIRMTDEYNKPWHNPETLRRLYHSEGLSQTDVAKELGCSRGAIEYQMEKHGIETRKHYHDPTYPPHHKFVPYSDDIGAEYEKILSRIDGKLYQFSIHRLMGVAHGLIEPDEFFDESVIVHHRNGHGLDNRESNLERMDRGDHVRHHVPWENSPVIDAD